MAQQNISITPFSAPFHTGDSAEKGETPNSLTTKLQANETELYGKVLAGSKYSTNAASGAATAAAGDLAGGLSTICNYSGIVTNNLTTRTAAQMIADAGLVPGQTYELEIMNSAASGSITLLGGTGVTISGTATIAFNACRWYSVKVVSASAITIQNLGSGTI